MALVIQILVPVSRYAVGRTSGGGASDSLGSQAQRSRVGARPGLGQREGAELLAGQHRRQPARLLLVVAPRHDRVLRQDVDAQRDGHRHVGVGDLLHDQRPGAVAEAGAADRLRERHGRQPQLAHAREQRAVVALLLVALAAPGAISFAANSRAVCWSSRSSSVRPPVGAIQRGGTPAPSCVREGDLMTGRRLGSRIKEAAPRRSGSGRSGRRRRG